MSWGELSWGELSWGELSWGELSWGEWSGNRQRAVERTEGLEKIRAVEETESGREDRGLLKKQMAVERIEGRTVDRGS
jgi:hypothetical protein